MTFEDFYPELESMVETIAFEYGGKGRRYGADNSDFRQEFIVWLLEHEKWVSQLMSETDPDTKAGHIKYLAKCLRNEAADYMRDIRNQALGVSRDDEYFYTRNEVKALLPNVFDKEKWTEPPVHDDSSRGSGKPASEGGNWIATLADVAQALERLEPDDRWTLEAFHRDGYTNKLLAEMRGLSEAQMSYYHSRALDRLHALLGGSKPFTERPDEAHDPWRGRHAVTNQGARAYQSRAYDEGVQA